MESRDWKEVEDQAQSYLLAGRKMGTVNHAKWTFAVSRALAEALCFQGRKISPLMVNNSHWAFLPKHTLESVS